MIDEKKLREKLAWLLQRPRYSTLSTGAREPLIEDFVAAAKESEIAEEPKNGTLKTVVTEQEAQAAKKRNKRDKWLL